VPAAWRARNAPKVKAAATTGLNRLRCGSMLLTVAQVVPPASLYTMHEQCYRKFCCPDETFDGDRYAAVRS
jgi:hypothetical protein